MIALSLAPAALSAAEPRTLEGGWPADYTRIGPVETAVIGGMAVGVLVVELAVSSPATPRWDSPILFDADARSVLRAGSQSGRSAAATVSDVGYIGLPAYAIGVEAGLVTWLGKGNADAALQLALINGEALALNGLLSRVVQKTSGRARPDASPATTDNTSFFSGHTSTAFAMASGLCVQHSKLVIYGNVADSIVCPASLTVAATTGLMRIVADRHWASDVIAGAIFGSVVGAGVSLFHLRGTGSDSSSLSLVAGGSSVALTGAF
jgi:membrane-associated phospholipid phosphatase